MKIIKMKRLKDNLNFVIHYEEDSQQCILIISAENVVKNHQAVEQLRAPDGVLVSVNESNEITCRVCGRGSGANPHRQ